MCYFSITDILFYFISTLEYVLVVFVIFLMSPWQLAEIKVYFLILSFILVPIKLSHNLLTLKPS